MPITLEKKKGKKIKTKKQRRRVQWDPVEAGCGVSLGTATFEKLGFSWDE